MLSVEANRPRERRRTSIRPPSAVALLAFLAVPPPAVSGKTSASDPCAAPLVVVDHATGKMFLELPGKARQELADGDEARVPTGSMRVRVIHTHTALYAYSVTGEPVEAKEIAALKGFLTALGPYWTEPRGPSAQGAVGEAPLQTKVKKAQDVIDALRRLESRTLDALDQIGSPSASSSVDPGATLLHESARDLVPSGTGQRGETSSCGDAPVRYRVKYVRELLDALRAVGEELVQVDQGAPAPPNVIAAARKMLADTDNLIAFAYRVEDLFNLAVNDRTVWCSPEISITVARGAKLTIKIDPRKEPELARLARLRRVDQTAKLYPDWLVRPGIGLALLYSASSVYPDVGTAASGSQFKIVPKGRQDFRFTYGLTLGMTWRGLDWRDGSGFAFWLPELTVNPSSDVHALGVGLGFSWRIVKLGAGLLWTRHTVPDGKAFGDLLDNKDDLATRKAYGARKAYVSLSVFGWPPFLPNGK